MTGDRPHDLPPQHPVHRTQIIQHYCTLFLMDNNVYPWTYTLGLHPDFLALFKKG
jgi:hypothetical protein